MKWKQKRRPPSDAKEVAMTVRNLTILSWIGARASIDAVQINSDQLPDVFKVAASAGWLF
jgi:hypothetical protein